MDAFFLLLRDYTFQTVALGSLLLGAVSGVLGCFAVLRKQSLLGDGVSHASLSGVVLAFLLTGSKDTQLLLGGALVAGLFACAAIAWVRKRSRIKFDAALALVMSVLFGFGMVLLTYAQKQPNANQAGLNRFIYGQAATMLVQDVKLIAVCGAALLGLVALFWKEFKLLCFDAQFASSLGLPTGRYNLLLSLLMVLAIVLGLQTVGVVLMSALLVAPAVAARQWCNRLEAMVLLAAVFGAASGVLGTLLSSAITGLPTGPVIVVCASSIALVSLLFAPQRGMVQRLIQRRRMFAQLRAEGGEGR